MRLGATFRRTKQSIQRRTLSQRLGVKNDGREGVIYGGPGARVFTAVKYRHHLERRARNANNKQLKQFATIGIS